MTYPKRVHAAVVAAALCACPTLTHAQDTQPSTAPVADAAASGEHLIARITAIKGVVQVRSEEDQAWKSATVGMEVDEGAEFRTGPRSAVQFVIPPDQTITLDRLGTMKVLEAVKASGKVTTALGMKYGRARYDIQAADLEHDSTIRSPGSTLAIRGTDITFEDMAPFPPNAVSRTGRATFRNSQRQTVAFGGKSRANVSAERTSPAETALVRTRTDPQSQFSGRSEADKNLVLQLPSLGGNDLGRGLPGVHDEARQNAIREGVLPPPAPPPPPPPGPGPGPTPGPIPTPTPTPVPSMFNDLLFELTWTGDPFMDLDLQVARGGGEIVSGGPLNATFPPPPVPSGGMHGGNREADSLGNGREKVAWVTNPPRDYYLVRVMNQNSGVVNATVKVFSTDSTGTNQVISEFDNLPLFATMPFFQVHVPFPPNLPDPEPPLPPAPPFPQRGLPQPQPGPDSTMALGQSPGTVRSTARPAPPITGTPPTRGRGAAR